MRDFCGKFKLLFLVQINCFNPKKNVLFLYVFLFVIIKNKLIDTNIGKINIYKALGYYYYYYY